MLSSSSPFSVSQGGSKRTLFAVLVIFFATAGCGGKGDPPAPLRNWSEDPAIFTATGAEEIEVLGDVHGDVATTAHMLSVAGLITSSTPYHWTGGRRVLVVTGDVIDKGSSALAIIDLLSAMESEARLAGGRVVVTLGNHEAEFLADPTDAKSSVFQAELASRGLDPAKVATGDSKYGAWLLARPLAALIDGWFFSHAGNSSGESATVLGANFEHLLNTPATAGRHSRFDDPFLIGPNSILEQQVWWQASGSTATVVIEVNLEALPAKHLVFGHDPGAIDFPDDARGNRARGAMAARYDGRLFLVDVGMSSAVGYSDGAMLRITRPPTEQATALRADGTTEVIWP